MIGGYPSRSSLYVYLLCTSVLLITRIYQRASLFDFLWIFDLPFEWNRAHAQVNSGCLLYEEGLQVLSTYKIQAYTLQVLYGTNLDGEHYNKYLGQREYMYTTKNFSCPSALIGELQYNLNHLPVDYICPRFCGHCRMMGRAVELSSY